MNTLEMLFFGAGSFYTLSYVFSTFETLLEDEALGSKFKVIAHNTLLMLCAYAVGFIYYWKVK